MPAQFSFDRSWPMTDADAVPRLAAALSSEMSLTQDGQASETEAVLRSGSQLRTRLLGGWFIAPKHLPKRVHLSAASDPDGSRRLDVRVEDSLGPIAVRDRHFSRRYEAAADEVFAVVDRVL